MNGIEKSDHESESFSGRVLRLVRQLTTDAEAQQKLIVASISCLSVYQ